MAARRRAPQGCGSHARQTIPCGYVSIGHGGRSKMPNYSCASPKTQSREESLRKLTAVKISVRVIKPVLTNGAENIDVERILESQGFVRDVGRYYEHLTSPQNHFLAAHPEFQSSFDNVADLFAYMRVLRNQRVLFEVDL